MTIKHEFVEVSARNDENPIFIAEFGNNEYLESIQLVIILHLQQTPDVLAQRQLLEAIVEYVQLKLSNYRLVPTSFFCIVFPQ